MAPILDFEVFFHTEMQGSFRGVTHLGSRSPLQVLSSPGARISLLEPVDRSRRFRPLMALVRRTLTSPKRSPRSGPLAFSVLRGRWFGARLRDLPPHSRFRAFDPLTQLSRQYQGLEWSVGLSRGAERFLFGEVKVLPTTAMRGRNRRLRSTGAKREIRVPEEDKT
jgi:hypothetical protein